MTAPGSTAERQEFFRTGAKPPSRFGDRTAIPVMAAGGWEAECRSFGGNEQQPPNRFVIN